ncbi:MAG: hypothetical protein OSA99_03220 [Acidimicrobiales bacterium]|nr:hypothetical protein [Acidimicrobiales bacterium]
MGMQPTDPPRIVLADRFPPTHPEQYTPARIAAWLRSSGGSLGERALKRAAADLIDFDAPRDTIASASR